MMMVMMTTDRTLVFSFSFSFSFSFIIIISDFSVSQYLFEKVHKNTFYKVLRMRLNEIGLN